jgi:hypothetical protein
MISLIFITCPTRGRIISVDPFRQRSSLSIRDDFEFEFEFGLDFEAEAEADLDLIRKEYVKIVQPHPAGSRFFPV